MNLTLEPADEHASALTLTADQDMKVKPSLRRHRSPKVPPR